MPFIAESYCFLVEDDLFPSVVETTAEFLTPPPAQCSSSDVTLLDDPADCANSDSLGICELKTKSTPFQRNNETEQNFLNTVGALVAAELSRAPEALLLDESIVGLTLSSSPSRNKSKQSLKNFSNILLVKDVLLPALVPAAGVKTPRDGGAVSCDFWYFNMVQSKT